MSRKPTGRLFGIPYDWRRPTRSRLLQRWWNTADRRVFVPKVFGWGFGVNLAEVARRLRLRR